MVWKDLKKWLGIMAVGATALLPLKGQADGYLQVYNYSPNSGVRDNLVRFVQNGSDGSYLPLPSPSMEIYYLNSNSNKLSTTSVDLSTTREYQCPLEFNGSIADGTSNSIAFKISNPWPSNTVCSAQIQTDSGYTNSLDDILGYTQTHSNSQGYAFVQLPNITNAVNGQKYGSVKMIFAPKTFTWTINTDRGIVSPGTTNYPAGTIATQILQNIIVNDPTNSGTRWIYNGENTQ